MRLADAEGYVERRDAISHDWIRALTGMGVTPVPLSNAVSRPVDYLRRVGAAGLVLTGGESVGGLPDELGPAIERSPRDATESELIAHALDSGLPVLAVCRGLQALNAELGGAIDRGAAGRRGHVGTNHTVELEEAPGSPTSGRATVNSFHEDGIYAATLAPDLRPFAWSDDGFIEGARHRNRPIVGVQWHPERPNPARDLDASLFRWWLTRCA